MSNLISWQTYRRSKPGVSTNKLHAKIHGRQQMPVRRTLMLDGFSEYGDIMDTNHYVCKGDTPHSIAKRQYANLLKSKPIDPADPRVVWTYQQIPGAGEFIQLYYKFKAPAPLPTQQDGATTQQQEGGVTNG